ncbi:MAG: molybdopterin molybdotransferase MoeA [Gemmataceae bacterium]|nr:molybdopterin molybdotransferase MoeA [Gemmataceae bacterium]MDW8266339.1 molybdopterin molybdotransferase MoeA [Gemmataceae bacterium]
MLSVAEAQEIVLGHVRPLAPVRRAVTPDLIGSVLAEEVSSDLDMPPYDKAMMDGIAVRSADLPDGTGVLTIVDEITAGRVPIRALGPGEAARIMTGAPIPPGADAVVMVERLEPLDAGRVRVTDRPPRPGQNIIPRGRELRQGDVILPVGSVLGPVEFGLLATVGRTTVNVVPAPEVAVLATGDELVDADRSPGPGQIRNGNGPMLQAQVRSAGGLPRGLGIARDDPDELRPKIAYGLESPVLLLSGGVSAGKLDLVPQVLRDLGVTAHFHKVAMKPGKPLLFGTHPGGAVFGLPGNPVSSLVCCELFVRPAIRRLRGEHDPRPRLIFAVLGEDFAYATDRPTYHPARLVLQDRGWVVWPVPWFGSADLRALAQANALAVFPAGDHRHRAGQPVEVLPLPWAH